MDISDGPAYLHVDFTSRCNLKCIHCRNNMSSDLGLSLSEWKGVVDSALENFPNFEQVFIGGGEPLIRKQEMFELIDYCNSKGLSCSLNTNALLIQEEDLENLKKVFAIQISLDGAKAKTHDFIRGVPGSFDKTIKKIKMLVKNGLNVCVRTTIFELNYTEILELLDLSLELGVNYFSWFRVLPSGKGQGIKNWAVEPKVYFALMKELTRKKYELKDKIKISSTEPLKIAVDEKLKGNIDDKYGKDVVSGCVPGAIEIFVSSEGDVYPCTMLRDFKLGNIKKNSLREIWDHSEILMKLRDRSALKGKCGSCNINCLCGGCRATAYGTTGDLLGEDIYCPKNFENNLDNIQMERGVSPCQAH